MFKKAHSHPQRMVGTRQVIAGIAGSIVLLLGGGLARYGHLAFDLPPLVTGEYHPHSKKVHPLPPIDLTAESSSFSPAHQRLSLHEEPAEEAPTRTRERVIFNLEHLALEEYGTPQLVLAEDGVLEGTFPGKKFQVGKQSFQPYAEFSLGFYGKRVALQMLSFDQDDFIVGIQGGRKAALPPSQLKRLLETTLPLGWQYEKALAEMRDLRDKESLRVPPEQREETISKYLQESDRVYEKYQKGILQNILHYLPKNCRQGELLEIICEN